MKTFSSRVFRAWIRQLSPMAFLSACAGAMDSPCSARASRPTRQGAPVMGARMLSPEQSMNTSASTRWKRWVVSWYPRMDARRSPAMVPSMQVQLSSRVSPGCSRAREYSTLSHRA